MTIGDVGDNDDVGDDDDDGDNGDVGDVAYRVIKDKCWTVYRL